METQPQTEEPHEARPDLAAESPPDASDAGKGPGSNDRSTVKFPYGDLEEAAAVVTTLKSSFGNSATTDQLAAAMSYSPTSSGFRTRVATAVAFQLVVNKKGTVSLTDLGHRVADEHTRPQGLVDAFLGVELYRLVYEEYQNRALPGDAGLQVQLRAIGVAPKQAERARRLLQRSATTAGMFWSGRDRLVKPPMSNTVGKVEPKDATEEDRQDRRDRDEEADSLADDPILRGMWQRLPREGNFPTSERERWLSALKINLDLVYGPADSKQTQVREDASRT